MRGRLYKTEQGWQVINMQATFNEPLFQALPLHPDDTIGIGQEKNEIEFEIIEFSVPPTNGPVSNSISKYAKIVDFVPMKGGEGWDKILDKAIQDKAETFTDGHYHYRGKDAFIEGYKQGQENTKGMKYTEEDMRELYAYAKNDNTNLEDYLQALNKQNSEWMTIKEGDITVNFKPMPEFNEPSSLYKYTEQQLYEAIKLARKTHVKKWGINGEESLDYTYSDVKIIKKLNKQDNE